MSPEEEFAAQLKADHFTDAVLIERPAGYLLSEHAHSFDARALILSGEFTLEVGGVATRYGAGDIFRLPAGTPHHEYAGPDGVRYLSGRREQTAK